MYCHAATGLVIVCQIVLSRCSKATLEAEKTSTRTAMSQKAPLVPYCRKLCTRYRSGWLASSSPGSAASPKISITMKTSEIFIRTASLSTFFAIAATRSRGHLISHITNPADDARQIAPAVTATITPVTVGFIVKMSTATRPRAPSTITHTAQQKTVAPAALDSPRLTRRINATNAAVSAMIPTSRTAACGFTCSHGIFAIPTTAPAASARPKYVSPSPSQITPMDSARHDADPDRHARRILLGRQDAVDDRRRLIRGIGPIRPRNRFPRPGQGSGCSGGRRFRSDKARRRHVHRHRVRHDPRDRHRRDHARGHDLEHLRLLQPVAARKQLANPHGRGSFPFPSPPESSSRPITD